MRLTVIPGFLLVLLLCAGPALARPAVLPEGEGRASVPRGGATSAGTQVCADCQPDPVDNLPPIATLGAPTHGQAATTGDTVTLSASASDSDGSVVHVQFFVDGASVGVDPAPPYSMAWVASAGSHTVHARALDNGGLATETLRATLAVTDPAPAAPAPSPATSKTEGMTYEDNTARWVLGQVRTLTCLASVPASPACDGDEVSATTFDPTTALPLVQRAFGQVRATATYASDGTLATVQDGNQRTTTFANWKRGVPRSVQHADGTAQAAAVDDQGRVTAITDENGYTTTYAYDAMGRLAGIAYPLDDSTAWAPTTRTFVAVAAAEYGIPAGHWRLTESTGNAVKVTYYDALWRPRLVREYDSASQAATQRFTAMAYDGGGHVTFASYPSAASAPSTGVWTTYDALGRVTAVGQDTELSPALQLTTTTYGPGFTTTVTNPRGFATTVAYLTYDQPATDWPLAITAPEGAITTLARDPHGKPLSLTRGGTGVAPATREYAYDATQQLCRSQEPETGATLYGYDAAGNLIASAAGLPLGTACGTATPRTVSRSYDARNRLATLAFPDGNGNQAWRYTPDGLPELVTTLNDGQVVSNQYSYNRRRLLTGESMTADDLLPARAIGYGYNPLGQVVTESSADDVLVTYTRNALGQAINVVARLDGGSQRNVATAASYYPNGALRQFTYGNGIVHAMTQNARQLPARSVDGAVLDLATAFDANGNVLAITDATPAARQTRSMIYDGLDRLTSTRSPMFGSAGYAYDPLDNLTRVQVTGGPQPRDHTYCYNPTSNRLDFVRSGPACTGAASPAVTALGYDLQGNLQGKNGVAYAFDYGNRLRATAGLRYRYDADGRRVRQDNAGAQLKYSHYSKDGRLLWQRDEASGTRIANVYLAGSLVAEYSRPLAAPTVTARYVHTDALGSPIATTDASGAVTQTSEYEPYGALLNRPNDDRAGYTGHVMDSASGLTYMQQRYYDPQIGRFLSVDPVSADTVTGWNFNRYNYAAGNPYKFTDPDGRDIVAELRAYVMGNLPFQGDYAHQYLYLRDTDTGEEVISRGGPSVRYPGGLSAVASNSAVKDPGGNGNVTLVANLTPAAESRDANANRPGESASFTVEGSSVTIPGNIQDAIATLQAFNTRMEAAAIDYKPLSTNSNAYAGTAYTELTGQAAPNSHLLPGSDVDLNKQMNP